MVGPISALAPRTLPYRIDAQGFTAAKIRLVTDAEVDTC
jgi:hypothetical protein